MKISIAQVPPKQTLRFGGVRITKFSDKAQCLTFQVFPDTYLKGIEYRKQIRTSAAADELTSIAGDFVKNRSHKGNVRLYNLHLDESARLTSLLSRIIDDSAMSAERKSKLKKEIVSQERKQESNYEVDGATNFYYEGLGIDGRLVPVAEEKPIGFNEAKKLVTLHSLKDPALIRALSSLTKYEASTYSLLLGELADINKASPEIISSLRKKGFIGADNVPKRSFSNPQAN